MKTILVTGGAGFIGSNFVRYIYNKYPNYKILVLDALTYAGSVHNLPEGGFSSERFEFWYGNVRNAELVDTLMSRTDMVVHFAAESHVTRSIYDNLIFFETDVIGTQVIANSVLKYKDRIERFIHISTSEVYGSAQSELMGEEHPLLPMSPYAAAKCSADRLVYSYYQTYKIPSVIIRPFNNYGCNQHLEKLVPRLVTSCILEEPMRVHGDGSASRDWLFVQDNCLAIESILLAPASKVVGEEFNIGTAKSLSVLEMANIVKDVMKSSSRIEFVGDRPGQVFRHTCDYKKIRKATGWEPTVRLDDGLAKTAEWYKLNKEWWQSQMWMREIPIITAAGKVEKH